MVDISCIEEEAMSLLIFHYCIWDFPCDFPVSHSSFVLFVAISSDSVMLLFQGHVACQNFTPTGPPYCVFLIGSFTCT